MFQATTQFFREAYAELKKVTWMSRQEVIGSTIVIIVLVTIISIFVALVDFVFIRMVGWFI